MSSTEIPKAMENTNRVEGFKGILKYPMIPAVIIKGTRLGIKEMTTIRGVLNNKAIKIDVTAMAKIKLCNKLLTRYLVVSKSKTAAPVTETEYFSLGKIYAVVAWTWARSPFNSWVDKSCD